MATIQDLEKGSETASQQTTVGNTTTPLPRSSKYQEMLRAKEDALCLHEILPGTGQKRSHSILGSLYSRCEAIAKMRLLRDYANGYVERPEKWDRLQSDIDRYENIRRQKIVLHLAIPGNFGGKDGQLLQMAAQLAVVEEAEQASRTDQPTDAILATVVEQAKLEFSSLINSHFANDKYQDSIKAAKSAKEAEVRAMFSRLRFAIFGGLSMMLPVLIMQLLQDTLTTLLTISLFTLFVAAIFATTIKTADSKDVILATAAYAAVLVLFLSNSIPNGTNLGYIPPLSTCNDDGYGYCDYVQEPGTTVGVVVGTNIGAVLVIVGVACLATGKHSLPRFRRAVRKT